MISLADRLRQHHVRELPRDGDGYVRRGELLLRLGQRPFAQLAFEFGVLRPLERFVFRWRRAEAR